MARQTKAISEELLNKCQERLKQIGPNGDAGRKLQAIISAKKHGIKKIAEIFNVTRQTIMDWIHAFKTEDVEGFKVKTGRGRKSKVDEKIRKELKEWVKQEGRKMTSKRLKQEIEKRYQIVIGLSSANRLLHELGFSHITGRPKHYKQDKSKQEEFKKKTKREDRAKSE
jgi:transposase